MNSRIIKRFLIIVLLSAITNICYSCPVPPEIEFDSCVYQIPLNHDFTIYAKVINPEQADDIVLWTYSTSSGLNIVGTPTQEPEKLTITVRSSYADYYTVTVTGYTESGPPGCASTSVIVILVGLDINDVSEYNEENPGGFVAVNDDDDNNNGKPDYNYNEEDIVANENDLVPIYLYHAPPRIFGYMRLYVNNNTIGVWSDSHKGTRLLDGNLDIYEVDWSPCPCPPTLYVEGFSAGSLAPVLLTHEFAPDSGIGGSGSGFCDQVNFWPIQVWNMNVPEFIAYESSMIFSYYIFVDYYGTPDSVKYYIKDGDTILREEGLDCGAGDYAQNAYWDGMDSTGNFVDAGQYTVEVEVTKNGIKHSAKQDLTIVKVDLDTDINGDGNIDEDDEMGEDDPGAYVILNNDDDDEDGVIDNDDGYNKDGISGNDDDGNTQEDNLVPITLSYQPSLNVGKVKLEVVSGSSNIKIWGSATKGGNPLTGNDLEWNLSSETVPSTLYVEGVSASSCPQNIELKLSYLDPSDNIIHDDHVKLTVLELKVYIDDDGTNVLEDWPEDTSEGLLRSPMYVFGSNNPIYVEIKNLDDDPLVAKEFQDIVKVTSESYTTGIKLNLKETGINTNVFNNIESLGELLYLSTTSDATSSGDKIEVINEEILTFSLEIPPGSDNYQACFNVMVDRAEMGAEYQDFYTRDGHVPGLPDVPCHAFGQQLYDNIGGSP